MTSAGVQITCQAANSPSTSAMTRALAFQTSLADRSRLGYLDTFLSTSNPLALPELLQVRLVNPHPPPRRHLLFRPRPPLFLPNLYLF